MRRWWDRGCRRRGVDNPHAMGASGDEFGDSVSEGRLGSDVEDGIRILAVVHATLRENDGDEVDARRVEQRQGGCVGQQLDINVRDVADDVLVIVEHG